MGEVLHLFRSLAKGKPVSEIAEVSILENQGLEGCVHGRPGSDRQVLLMDIETLKRFDLVPGQIKENLTTQGIAISDLKNGQLVRAGRTVLEVRGPCEPCEFIEGIRPGLQAAMQGQRGVLCRAIHAGIIRRGDTITVMEQASGIQ
jgi:MOSC domain-containing protein YiiM